MATVVTILRAIGVVLLYPAKLNSIINRDDRLLWSRIDGVDSMSGVIPAKSLTLQSVITIPD